MAPMHTRNRLWLFTCMGIALCAGERASVYADRPLDKADYADKLRGIWFGQLIGNHTGRPTEGQYTLDAPLPPELFV